MQYPFKSNKTIFRNVTITYFEEHTCFSLSDTIFVEKQAGYLKEHAAHVAQVLLHCAF